MTFTTSWFQGPILVAPGTGPHSDLAITQAGAVAAAAGVALTVTVPLPEVFAVRPLFPQLNLDDAFALADVEAKVREEATARVARVLGEQGREVAVHFSSGSRHAVILREAERLGAGAIVMPFAESSDPTLGTRLAERVVRHAHVPVLVVRPSPADGVVLAATDFSDPALPALHAGAIEARRLGAPLTILHASDVLPVGGAPELPVTTGALNAMELVRQDLQRRLEETARLLEGEHGAPVRTFLADGPPARVIIERAQISPAQLVVVGTHGRTGLSRLALGSTAEDVLQRCPCSVLVVRLRT